MGTSDSITLAYSVPTGTGSGSSSSLKRRCIVRRGPTVTRYGPTGSRSAKNSLISTCAGESDVFSRHAVS
jgi:hypothetical protein